MSWLITVFALISLHLFAPGNLPIENNSAELSLTPIEQPTPQPCDADENKDKPGGGG